MVPPGPKATLVTPPSLISIGSARSRSPFASSSTTPPTSPPTSRAYPAAMVPPGPKAMLVTPPSLISVRSVRSRFPFASSSTTPPAPPAPSRAYPAAMVPSGPKATLVTPPSGVSRKRETSGRLSMQRCRLPQASRVSVPVASTAKSIAWSSRTGLTASESAASRRDSAIRAWAFAKPASSSAPWLPRRPCPRSLGPPGGTCLPTAPAPRK